MLVVACGERNNTSTSESERNDTSTSESESRTEQVLYFGDVQVRYDFETECVTLDQSDAEFLLSILNSEDWLEGAVTETMYDFTFYIQGVKLYYVSEMGRFNDVTNIRSGSLSDEDQETLNAILASYYIDD